MIKLAIIKKKKRIYLFRELIKYTPINRIKAAINDCVVSCSFNTYQRECPVKCVSVESYLEVFQRYEINSIKKRGLLAKITSLNIAQD
ncbi:hypothetical protein KAOT1_02161 [Kordia algicida OT-1]|uniref:Uncharacterized protein n=1 Tax=Kordia algicida OT-1 TaxID=391587 RepID=A9CUB9_9FLAO|nr:hypothetical protein KAOT1_02161 [Kordia algicida OT-1]